MINLTSAVHFCRLQIFNLTHLRNKSTIIYYNFLTRIIIGGSYINVPLALLLKFIRSASIINFRFRNNCIIATSISKTAKVIPIQLYGPKPNVNDVPLFVPPIKYYTITKFIYLYDHQSEQKKTSRLMHILHK